MIIARHSAPQILYALDCVPDVALSCYRRTEEGIELIDQDPLQRLWMLPEEERETLLRMLAREAEQEDHSGHHESETP